MRELTPSIRVVRFTRACVEADIDRLYPVIEPRFHLSGLPTKSLDGPTQSLDVLAQPAKQEHQSAEQGNSDADDGDGIRVHEALSYHVWVSGAASRPSS